MKNIIILAGGRSVKDFPQDVIANGLTSLAYTVGVNDAAIYAKVNVAVSMDRLWTENRWQQVKSTGVQFVARREALKNVPPQPWIFPFECGYDSTAMSKGPGTFNGTNSGMCAMNYAFSLKPKRVFLLGFDTHRPKDGSSPYWYPPYPWANPLGATKSGKYRDWLRQHDYVAKQFIRENIKVYTVGRTALNSYTNLPWLDFLVEVQRDSD